MTARHAPAGPVRATPARGVPVVLAALFAVLVAACGAPTATPSPSASPAPSSGGAVAPQPTRWPGGVVEAVVILAKADLEIQAAGGDLGVAAADQDLERMWGAADGLATLLERLEPHIPRIADYPETAAAAAAYRAAWPDMLAGARGIRDSITAGDAAALAAASRQLATGLDAYREARRLIGPLFDQAILMQRILVK